MIENHIKVANQSPLYAVLYCKPLLPYISALKVVQSFVCTPFQQNTLSVTIVRTNSKNNVERGCSLYYCIVGFSNSTHTSVSNKPSFPMAGKSSVSKYDVSAITLGQHRTIPALRPSTAWQLRHGICVAKKCSIRHPVLSALWLGICRTSPAVSALRIMRYCSCWPDSLFGCRAFLCVCLWVMLVITKQLPRPCTSDFGVSFQ